MLHHLIIDEQRDVTASTAGAALNPVVGAEMNQKPPDSDSPGSNFKYWAFISYSHQDKQWGDWLHRALETYRLPRHLRAGRDGDVPGRLMPVFRDREELPSSANLGQVIAEALQQSRTLIVICSPSAARSRWVNEEILTFKRLGRADRILSLIVDGEPNASDKPALGLEECFPPALRFKLGPDGTLGNEQEEPIAADVRPGMDGNSNAKLKLVAGVVGVGFDELKQRDLLRRQRQLVAITFSALAIMVVTIGLAVAALISRSAAIFHRRQAEINLSEAKRQEGIAKTNEAEAKRQEQIAKDKEAEAKISEKKARDEKERADIEKEQARRSLYDATIGLAINSWNEGKVPQMLEQLNFLRPTSDEDDLRGFEWYYLMRLPREGLTTLRGPILWVSSVAFHPDGKRLATCTGSTITLWNLDTGQQSYSIEYTSTVDTRISFSPDGKRLLSSVKFPLGAECAIKMWDVETGKEVLEFKMNSDSFNGGLIFSPDGKRVAGVDDHTVKVWDAVTGKELVKGSEFHGVDDLAFSPNGQWLASGGQEGTVKIWDATSGQLLRTLKGHSQPVYGVAFTPDGKWVASGSADKTLKLWDAATGDDLRTFKGHTNQVTSVAFSSDGVLASASRDQTVRLWDAKTGEELQSLKGHTADVDAISFSADGRKLASTGKDKTINIWDVDLARRSQPDGFEFPPSKMKSPQRTTNVAFSADGKQLAANSGGKVVIWDTANGQTSLTFQDGNFPSQIRCFALSPDGKKIASIASREVIVWDIVKGTKTTIFKGHLRGEKLLVDTVLSLAFNPDGTTIASAGEDMIVKVWNASDGKVIQTLRGHTSRVNSVAFSPDGRMLASASGKPWSHLTNGEAILWNVSTGEPIFNLRGHTKGINGVAFSHDGKFLATAGSDHTIRLWDTATGLQTLVMRGHADAVLSVAFDRQGKRLASGSVDQTVKVWGLLNGQELLTLKGHTDKVTNVAFHPDGSLLVSAGDKELRVWNASIEQQSYAFNLRTELGHPVFSPDGKRLAGSANNNSVKVFDVVSGRELFTLLGHDGHINALAYSPDGKLLASAGQNRDQGVATFKPAIKLWDAATGKNLLTLGDTREILSREIRSITFSPDSKYLISGGDDALVKVWDVATGKGQIAFSGHDPGQGRSGSEISTLAYSPDGQRVVSGGRDGRVKVWDVRTGTELLKLESPNVREVRFSPDGKRLVGAGAGGRKVWDAATGAVIPFQGRISTVFSPDGRFTAGGEDTTVKLWDATTGQEVLSLKGHVGKVSEVAFSPDGRYLASAGHLDTVMIWDLAVALASKSPARQPEP